MLNIMVVDDEEELVEILTEEMYDAGYAAQGFIRPSEALTALDYSEFDLVISDIRMPELDGLELLKEAKKSNNGFPHFIFCTGFSDYRESELIDQGAMAVFQKPVDMEEIVTWIKENYRRSS